MSKAMVVDGQIVYELSINEFKSGLFRLAGESNAEYTRLLREFEKRALEEVLASVKAKDAGKSKQQIIFERMRRRESARHQRQLNCNMRNAGIKKVPSTSNHHIVAWSDRRADIARAILKQFGIEINSHYNGVKLPTAVKHTPHPKYPNAYPHSTVHTDIYYANVELLLKNQAAMDGVSKEDIVSILQEIATELQQGIFPLKERITGR